MTENEQESGLTPEDEAYFASEGEVAEDVAAFDAQDEGDAQASDDTQSEAVTKPADDASAEGDKGSRTVPHGALHAEREEHKKTKSELQDLRNRLMKVEWIQEQKAAGTAGEQDTGKPEDLPEINPEEDIFGAFRQKSEKLTALEQRLAEFANQRRQEDEQYEREEQNARYIQGLGNFARQSVVDYAQKDASISDAQKWLIDYKHKQFNAERFSDPRNADPAYRQYRMNVETLQAAEQAYQEGRDFGEVVMEYARELGWQGNGQASDEIRQKVDRIGQAQQQSRTVAQAAGSGGGDELSIETIDGWDMPTFKRWYSEPKNARYYDRLLAQG